MANEKNEVLITRIINAPRELVYKAWTKPEHLMQWYAPTGCTIRFAILDIRKGGTYHSCITIPGGKECWCVGEYLEIIPNEKIVQTMAVGDEKGNRISAIDAGMDKDWPDETTLTVTFEDAPEGKTKITLHQTVNEDLAKRTGAHPSWLIMLDLLEELLSKEIA